MHLHGYVDHYRLPESAAENGPIAFNSQRCSTQRAERYAQIPSSGNRRHAALMGAKLSRATLSLITEMAGSFRLAVETGVRRGEPVLSLVGNP